MDLLTEKRERLLALLSDLPGVVVAFSGGVDSAVVAQAAYLALGDRAVAATAVSPSLAEGELDGARQLAEQIGISHHILRTSEFTVAGYRANAGNRCYFCKTELYEQIETLLPQLGLTVICNGANTDDLGDHRPGMLAAQEHQVRSPLVEAGCSKADVRALAQHWNLPVWDKPAAPCLSSRIAYGVEVTPERVRRVDRAEAELKTLLGTRELRVRLEEHDLARIEVPLPLLSRFADADVCASVVSQLKALGFRRVTLDLEGFRSGSLNDNLPLVEIALPSGSRG